MALWALIRICTILTTTILSTNGKDDPRPPGVGLDSIDHHGVLQYTDTGGQFIRIDLKQGDMIAVTIEGTKTSMFSRNVKKVTFTRTYTCGEVTETPKGKGHRLFPWSLNFEVKTKTKDSTTPTPQSSQTYRALTEYLKKVWKWKSSFGSRKLDGVKPNSPPSIQIHATIYNSDLTFPIGAHPSALKINTNDVISWKQGTKGCKIENNARIVIKYGETELDGTMSKKDGVWKVKLSGADTPEFDYGQVWQFQWMKGTDKPKSGTKGTVTITCKLYTFTVPLKKDLTSSAHAAYDDMMDTERSRVRVARQLDYGDLMEEHRDAIALENAYRKRTIARLENMQREVRAMERAMNSPR